MHKLALQIRFNDVDGVGHVNNNTYGEYFDMGRLGYFEKALGEQIDWRRGKIMVLVHTECDFLRPTFLYDTIEVQTQVTEIGNRSLKMAQRIVDSNGVVKVEGCSVLSTLDLDTGNSFPMLDAWRERIEAFEKNCEK